MWSDHWVPMKILNPTKTPITLHHKANVADVFPCLAVEDQPISQGVSRPHASWTAEPVPNSDQASDLSQRLKECGLADTDLEGCEVSEEWTQWLVNLVLTYQKVFSKDKLDCGMAKGLVLRIHLTNDRPFRELSPQDWTPACEEAFEGLKSALLNSVVVAHPDFDRPFVHFTDASLDGLGAVLSQVCAGG